MARNKIGFLRGPGGRGEGFDRYVRELDAAGIPAVVGAYDVTDGLLDVLKLNSDVPHTLYYRVVRDGSERYAVPQYHLTPAQAAKAHWDLVRPHIAKEVADNRDKVWIAPINEVDRNRYDWIGYFSIEIGKLMMAEGFRQIAIGSNAGEPEPEAWETPGMLAYLRECEKYPDSLGICLHEGSFTVDRMVWDGWTIGRFRFLHDTCDRHGIRRPKIIIGEFGWSHRDIPPTDVAMQHIAAMSREYAKYPNILGVGIWYLGKYTGDIANKVQRLIQPVTEFTLVTEFEDPAVEPEPEEPVMDELKQALWDASLNVQRCRGVNFNPAFGFPANIRNLGYWPVTSEETVVIGDKAYVLMAAEHPLKEQPRRVWAYPVPWGSGPVIEITDPKA